VRKLVDGANDFLTTAVVNSNSKSDFFIVLGFLLPVLKDGLNV